ncbi:MAG: GNAT family N-acetyltransferase [Bacteroidota bacterium]
MKMDSAAAAEKLEILDYAPAYRAYFKSLNEAWIEKYFHLEEFDRILLNQPVKEIIALGGSVLFARLNGEIIGTCGLVKKNDHTFELVKMAVDEKAQGKKIGFQLGQAAIDKARQLGATTLELYSATSLSAAIHLYRKLGFEEVPLACGQYARCDIKMELNLLGNSY